MYTSYQISNNLYLINKQINKKSATTVVVETPTNYLLIIDCSGSMYHELPKIGEQLKKKLPKLLKKQDTVSIIWFSGKGEFGTLLEAEPVSTLTDLKLINAAIDRWLRPLGSTGFKEPLESIPALVSRISKNRPNSLFSALFLSDGYDNNWSKSDILSAVSQMAEVVSSTTIVEYGYYADRQLLSQMAEKAGGSLIFADNFDKYSPVFDNVITKTVSSAKRIKAKVEGEPVCDFVYAFQGNDLLTFNVNEGTVSVPSDVTQVFYVSNSSVGDVISFAKCTESLSDLTFLPAAYAAMSLFAVRMRSDIVYPLLKTVGDVNYIEQFSNCFGKQAYSDFMQSTKEAAFGKNRYLKGYDPNKVPREDSFTVLELLNLLQNDSESKLIADFEYKKIGKTRLDADGFLTKEESEQVNALTLSIVNEKNLTTIKEVQEKIAAITNKQKPLVFKEDENKEGYTIDKLVFNEERPNVSIMVRKTGTVDLTERNPSDNIPAVFPTHVFRNYTVIKDGIVNIDVLPVRLSEGTKNLLSLAMHENRLAYFDLSDAVTYINLRNMPVINRKQVKSVSAQSFFQAHYDLVKAQAAQKVYKAYLKELFPDSGSKFQGLAELYGADNAAWLKDQGIKDDGFAPKSTVTAPSTDKYMGKELKVSLKGLSSLPSLKEAKEKIAKTKVTASVGVMKPFIEEAAKLTKEQLEKKLEEAVQACRGHLFSIATTTFCIVVGQVWFREFKSLDENKMKLGDLECEVNMKEVEIEI